MPAAVVIEEFADYRHSVEKLLAACAVADVLAAQRRIVIKPNLVNTAPPPVTVAVECVVALIRFIRACSDAEILVAEAPGEVGLDAGAAFRCHGYDAMARACGVALLDLDQAELVCLEDASCPILPRCWMPRIVRESFLVSVAVLKAHSLAGVTLSMKNMLGCAPAAHYRQGGRWNKSFFHQQMQESVVAWNRYRKPDLAVIDASVGLAAHHLGGPTCEPPLAKLVAGCDPVAVDAAGAGLLGCDWRHIGHIRMAHGVLGDAEAGATALERAGL